MINRTTLVRQDKNQTIKIPEEFAFPDDVSEVEISRQGECLVISPIRAAGSKFSWAEFFAKPGIDEDFLQDREQPPMQERK